MDERDVANAELENTNRKLREELDGLQASNDGVVKEAAQLQLQLDEVLEENK